MAMRPCSRVVWTFRARVVVAVMVWRRGRAGRVGRLGWWIGVCFGWGCGVLWRGRGLVGVRVGRWVGVGCRWRISRGFVRWRGWR